MKKKTFTIIELIIVMTILSIMFLMTKNYLSGDNKIYIEGETCINSFYSDIREVQNASLLSRNRELTGSLGSASFVPEWYNIIFKEPRILSYQTPNHYFHNMNEMSGFIKTLMPIKANTGTLNGTLHAASVVVTMYDLIGQTIFYRGTGNVTLQPLSNNYNQYKILYPPIGYPLMLPNTIQYQYSSKCSSRDYFVSYKIEGNTGNVSDTLRIGFQTTSSQNQNQNVRKMILWKGQRGNGTNTITQELITGAIDLMVCNKNVACKETHRLFIDTRVGEIFLQKCGAFTANQTCSAWQGGNIN